MTYEVEIMTALIMQQLHINNGVNVKRHEKSTDICVGR